MKVQKATPEEVEEWRAEAEAQGVEWMFVIHDVLLDEDYPAFYVDAYVARYAREYLEKRTDKSIVAEVRV